MNISILVLVPNGYIYINPEEKV